MSLLYHKVRLSDIPGVGSVYQVKMAGYREKRSDSGMATTGKKSCLGECDQQRLSLLQVFGVKAFGEPVVDFGQHVMCFMALALLLPQPRQAQCRSQFQRLGLLLASNLYGLEKPGFSFSLVVCRANKK